ncbi:unnamed protein product [Mytilus coruscus]|uniref:MULE transposase domain-containing protein n=1 Tax=Mytilus coruscus TaxID=42192 RepID=A0A6J8DLZ0_MYTCO|nr:unnamed protein product [Mytilus coruscus]
MYGLSAVINNPLQSYYPPLVSSNYHTEPYHRKIVRRHVNESEKAAVTVMWTMKVRPQPFAVFDPNHFVPLLRLQTTSSQFVVLDDSSDQDHTSNQSNAKSNKYNKEGTNQDHKNHCRYHENDISSDHYNRDKSSQQHNKNSDNVDSNDATYNNESIKPKTTDQTGESEERTFADIFGESDPDESVSSDNLSFIHNQRRNGSDDANDSFENGDNDSLDDVEKDDSVDEMSNSGIFQPEEQLRYGECLNLEELLNKLKSSKDVRPNIPEGRKDNVCFTIDNSRNIERRLNNLHDGKLKAVVCRQGKFCIEKQINKKKEFIPVEPQPTDEQIVEISRSYSTLKQHLSYKKRVTRVGKAPPSFEINFNAAVVEYKGKHPGFSAHGNSKNGIEFTKLADVDTSDLVIGSDQEGSLVKAIVKKFPEATHVLCTRHLNLNLSEKMKNGVGMQRKDRIDIEQRIFGRNGILNADDSPVFEEKGEEVEEFC